MECFAHTYSSFEAGGNFIDTAELYPVPPRAETCGRTEEYIGRWLKSRNNRESIVLASKVMGGGGDTRSFVAGNRSVPPNPMPPIARLERGQILDAVDASLRRLQTDYLDLLQLHWPDRYVPKFGKIQFRAEGAASYEAYSFEEQVQTIGELIKSGKIRYWGLSNETTYGVMKMCQAARDLGVPPPISIQNDFSLIDRLFEGHLAEACYYEKIGLLVYGGLAGGVLTDKYHDGSKVPDNSRHKLFPHFQPRYYCERSMTAAKKYYDLAKRKGLKLSTLSYAFCESRFYVDSTIIGATNMEQLKENMEAFDVILDEETLAEVDAIHLECRNPSITD